ncbi:MAG: helix-turn-helix domain-containing protein [Duodenibacillus sp.]|nr:helix-turn-helix domain-containing protein [Duodenibacillus sp.]
MRPSLAVEESLGNLGWNIKATRLKRRIPQATLAERSGVSLSTLTKIEKGDCGVAIGTVASVLMALGLGTPFSEIASIDPLVQELENEVLPKRIRSSSKKLAL